MASLIAGEATVDRVVAALDEAGYCIVTGFLSDERAAATREELTAILDRTDKRGRNNFEGFATRRMYAVFAKTRAFDDLATHALVLGVVERVLGSEHFQLSSPTGIEIGPGESAQLLHRDDGKYPLPRPFDEVIVNTMWALDDFTEENGATVVYPGSHTSTVDERGEGRGRGGAVLVSGGSEGPRRAKLNPAAEGRRAVQAVMPRGSVMFYRGSVLHGGGANRSERSRMGVILEYAAGWLRPQETHTLAVPPETVAGLEPRLQRLLGYGVHPPFIGYVDGRDPRRLLEKFGGKARSSSSRL